MNLWYNFTTKQEACLMNKIQQFLLRHNIPETDIIYILREDKKTAIHTLDGRVTTTYTPLKTVLAGMNADAFLNINKGIALAVSQIQQVENGIYTMRDGRIFKGRARTPMQHRHNQQIITSDSPASSIPLEARTMLQRFSILDKMPVAFCIIELVFDQRGRGIDFIFRYCNQEMAVLENTPIDQLLNRSFYEVFENGDKKWLVTYADVALNGTSRIIHSYSPEIDSQLTIYCFQPMEGYCACALINTALHPQDL